MPCEGYLTGHDCLKTKNNKVLRYARRLANRVRLVKPKASSVKAEGTGTGLALLTLMLNPLAVVSTV